MSASVDMAGSMSFNGQSLNQQQRISADMRSMSSKKYCFIVSCCNVVVLGKFLRNDLVIPRAGYRSYVTGSIHGWSRSHLTCISGGC